MRERTTRFVLLGILAAGGPMTGYDLRGWIDQAIGHFWSESFGQIYPELRALAADGHIELIEDAGEPREGKRYRITAAGRRALTAWLTRAPQAERVRSEILLKLFFGRFLGADTARAFLEEAAQSATRRAGALRATAIEVRKDAATPVEDLVFSLIVIDRGVAVADAQREWAERSLRVMAALEADGPPAALEQWDREKGDGEG